LHPQGFFSTTICDSDSTITSAKEANPSLGGFPVAHSTPAAEDDDGDANERRKRGLKRSCGGHGLGTEGGGAVEARDWRGAPAQDWRGDEL